MVTRCETCPLRQHDAFLEMSATELRQTKQLKVGEMALDPGTPLLLQGKVSAHLYTVLAGIGLRLRDPGDGRRQVMSLVLPGDLVGLQAGLAAPMTYRVEARTRMRLCVFDRASILDAFARTPERAFNLTWRAADGDEITAAIGPRTADRVIAATLVRLWRRGEAVGLVDAGAMPLPIRQQDLADMLELSLVHLNKTLAKFRLRGLLTWRDGLLAISDLPGLAQIADLPATQQPAPRPLL